MRVEVSLLLSKIKTLSRIHLLFFPLLFRYILVVAMTYLSCLHLHRQLYEYGSYSLDITGPLMIITQKATSLAYSLVDGRAGEKKVRSVDNMLDRNP